MSALSELGVFMTAALASSYPGLYIETGDLPATPDTVLAIIKNGGSAPDLNLGAAGVQYEHIAVQLLARGAPNDFASPETLIQAAFIAFCGMEGYTAPTGTQYLMTHPLQSPFLTAVDDNLRRVFSVNFLVDKTPS